MCPTSVHGGVQGLDPAAQHLRSLGNVGHIPGGCDPTTADGFRIIANMSQEAYVIERT